MTATIEWNTQYDRQLVRLVEQGFTDAQIGHCLACYTKEVSARLSYLRLNPAMKRILSARKKPMSPPVPVEKHISDFFALSDCDFSGPVSPAAYRQIERYISAATERFGSAITRFHGARS